MEAVSDGELWRLWYTLVPSPKAMAKEIDKRLQLKHEQRMIPFTVICKQTAAPVGMTTFLNLEPDNKRLEIGGTWYRASVQKTAINTECKSMLLAHAFETLRSNAVEFRTHVLNRRSRQSIERLGAKLDGILRHHMILPNGTLRDTCVYSILLSEWQTVKANLFHLLHR